MCIPPDRKNATVVNTPRDRPIGQDPRSNVPGKPYTVFVLLLLLSISLAVVVYRQSLFEHERR